MEAVSEAGVAGHVRNGGLVKGLKVDVHLRGKGLVRQELSK